MRQLQRLVETKDCLYQAFRQKFRLLSNTQFSFVYATILYKNTIWYLNTKWTFWFTFELPTNKVQ